MAEVLTPNHVRNFWIEITVDGRTSRVACGPSGRDGGFTLSIKQRHDGEVIDALDVRGYATNETLTLQAIPRIGFDVHELTCAGTMKLITKR